MRRLIAKEYSKEYLEKIKLEKMQEAERQELLNKLSSWDEWPEDDKIEFISNKWNNDILPKIKKYFNDLKNRYDLEYYLFYDGALPIIKTNIEYIKDYNKNNAHNWANELSYIKRNSAGKLENFDIYKYNDDFDCPNLEGLVKTFENGIVVLKNRENIADPQKEVLKYENGEDIQKWEYVGPSAANPEEEGRYVLKEKTRHNYSPSYNNAKDYSWHNKNQGAAPWSSKDFQNAAKAKPYKLYPLVSGPLSSPEKTLLSKLSKNGINDITEQDVKELDPKYYAEERRKFENDFIDTWRSYWEIKQQMAENPDLQNYNDIWQEKKSNRKIKRLVKAEF